MSQQRLLARALLVRPHVSRITSHELRCTHLIFRAEPAAHDKQLECVDF